MRSYTLHASVDTELDHEIHGSWGPIDAGRDEFGTGSTGDKLIVSSLVRSRYR